MKPIFFPLLVFTLFLASCGLPPEDQVTPTATAMTAQPASTRIIPMAKNNETLAPTPEPTPTPAPEQIGGSVARVMWGDLSVFSPKDGPNRFDYLTPTPPEQWEQLKGELKLDTGEPVPLGKVLTYYDAHLMPIVPGLIRDVVLLDGLANGQPYYAVVLEFPAKKTEDQAGGSIFYVSFKASRCE